MFFTFGASDGIVNPVKYSYNVGIGGNGIVPGRPHDTFGVGWQRADISSNFVPFLRERLGLGLDHDDAVELYYNAWLTSWLGATLDLQIIDSALKKNPDVVRSARERGHRRGGRPAPLHAVLAL